MPWHAAISSKSRAQPSTGISNGWQAQTKAGTCRELPGLRSLHLRQAGESGRDIRVRRPVHILYFRVIRPGLVEIVRILHERMEPNRWLETSSEREEQDR